MTTQENKTIFVSFRISEEEFEVWEKAQHEQGFAFRSSFIRHHTNIGASRAPEKVRIRSDERTLHLKRIGTMLAELITLAANDNALSDENLSEILDDALKHIRAL